MSPKLKGINDPRNKISVAPNWFLLYDYLFQMSNFLDQWVSKELKNTKKKYGKSCIRKIKRGEVPISKKEETEGEKTKKGVALEKWRYENLKCFLAFVRLGDLAEYEDAFYYSVLINIFSQFEHNLNNICNEFAFQHSKKIKLVDFNGKGIYRATKYMEKVCEFKLPKKELFFEIILARDIRNCLAHSGGEINIDNKNLLERIKKHKLLKVIDQEFSNNKRVFFNKKYCNFIVKITKRYFLDLVKKNHKFLWHWELVKMDTKLDKKISSTYKDIL